MSDERVWLRHGEHGGFFECPRDAAEHWIPMGWVETDERPPEDNPVVAENLAAQAAAAAEQAPKKSSRGRGTADSQEG